MVLSLIKFWEKLVTHTITHVKKQSTISTTGKLFQLLFCICKSVCINVSVINIILKFNMDHEVGSQSQWNKIRFVLRKETNTFTLMFFALLVQKCYQGCSFVELIIRIVTRSSTRAITATELIRIIKGKSFIRCGRTTAWGYALYYSTCKFQFLPVYKIDPTL